MPPRGSAGQWECLTNLFPPSFLPSCLCRTKRTSPLAVEEQKVPVKTNLLFSTSQVLKAGPCVSGRKAILFPRATLGLGLLGRKYGSLAPGGLQGMCVGGLWKMPVGQNQAVVPWPVSASTPTYFLPGSCTQTRRSSSLPLPLPCPPYPAHHQASAFYLLTVSSRTGHSSLVFQQLAIAAPPSQAPSSTLGFSGDFSTQPKLRGSL